MGFILGLHLKLDVLVAIERAVVEAGLQRKVRLVGRHGKVPCRCHPERCHHRYLCPTDWECHRHRGRCRVQCQLVVVIPENRS